MKGTFEAEQDSAERTVEGSRGRTATSADAGKQFRIHIVEADEHWMGMRLGV